MRSLASNKLFKLIVVRFGKQLQDVLAVTSLLKEFAERVVAELTCNEFQSAQVPRRFVRRGNEQEHYVHRIAVKAVEFDALVAHGNRANQFLDAGVLGVRNGDSATDAGASQLFAFDNRTNEAFIIVSGQFASFDQRIRHLANSVFFFRRLKIGINRI